ncbi:YesL family protein [Gracilibacillus xinjiangensis]|uniref:YesL family protein n=1 Tax=Gracilibacillus xinjiangensis TaxID=1193282 RepID=A0ABV8WZL0_9BACI
MLGDGYISKFYYFGETVFLLLYVNFLWVCFTLAGLVVFGIGPSTVAMFTIFRKWSMDEDGIRVFQLFWKTYKKEFRRANVIGILLLLFGYMLYVNLNFLELRSEGLQQLMKTLLIITTVVYGIMLIYIFPMYVHYENKLFVYLKNAILIAVYSPIRTIYLIAACLTLYYLYFVLPVFIFFFGASLTSLVIMWITYRTFLRLELRQEKLQESEV